jgi:prolyl oligopeptidase PreP (S9A serine peptidase family)
MDVINDLVRIKIFREEKAELAMIKAKVKFIEAEKSLEQARKVLREHKKDCIAREKALYDDLCTRIVLLKDINSVTLDIDLMAEKTLQLENELEKIKEERDIASDELDMAKAVHRGAVQMRQKFTEIKETIDSEKLAELLQKEDLELEEVASKRQIDGEDSTEELEFY